MATDLMSPDETGVGEINKYDFVTPSHAVFKAEKVGCINWGLVSGKSNTIFPWGSKKGTTEPKVWFHDLFRPDGTPFDSGEVALFRELTGRGTATPAGKTGR